MSELTFICVPANSCFNPVLAHLCFVLCLVDFQSCSLLLSFLLVRVLLFLLCSVNHHLFHLRLFGSLLNEESRRLNSQTLLNCGCLHWELLVIVHLRVLGIAIWLDWLLISEVLFCLHHLVVFNYYFWLLNLIN